MPNGCVELEDRSGVNWHVQFSDTTDVTYSPRLMHWGGTVHLYDDKRCKILLKSCIVESHCDILAVDTRQPEWRDPENGETQPVLPDCDSPQSISPHNQTVWNHYWEPVSLCSQADPASTKSHRNAVHFQCNKGCCTSL